MKGETFQGTVTMRVTRDSEVRELMFRLWSQGDQKATLKILRPAKDHNTGNLRIGYELWQYLPNLEKTIKIPTSMMLQNWMGSDFTNDDLVRTSSLYRDYHHRLLGKINWRGFRAIQIECIPKSDSVVVWGKVILTVRDPDSVPLKQEFYNENQVLQKVMEGARIQSFGLHTVPTWLTMTLPKKEGHKTEILYSNIVYDEPISDGYFTQEFLKKTVKEKIINMYQKPTKK